jgi:hypothetical protein
MGQYGFVVWVCVEEYGVAIAEVTLSNALITFFSIRLEFERTVFVSCFRPRATSFWKL